MHRYPLYSPVRAECLCCRLGYDATFKSKTDQVICPTCCRHQGNSPQEVERRTRDHTEQARQALQAQHDGYERRLALMKQQCDVYRAELERIGGEIDELRDAVAAGIANTPPESVQRWWESEAIRDAQAKRDIAYRARDKAYRSIWYLDRIHHHDEQNDRKCSCGKAATGCKDLQVLDEIVEALDRWERNQVERCTQGKEHGLPWDHPAVMTASATDRWWRYRAAR